MHEYMHDECGPHQHACATSLPVRQDRARTAVTRPPPFLTPTSAGDWWFPYAHPPLCLRFVGRHVHIYSVFFCFLATTEELWFSNPTTPIKSSDCERIWTHIWQLDRCSHVLEQNQMGYQRVGVRLLMLDAPYLINLI
jgi:hypothetical protein